MQLLVDVHLLEATLNVRAPQVTRTRGPITLELPVDTIIKGVVLDPSLAPPIGWYDIFKKHGITKQQYESSMKWYSSQPQKLNLMYDDVITELTKRQMQERAK